MGSTDFSLQQFQPSGALGEYEAGGNEGEIAAELGSEVATVLSSALERLNTLAATGRIDRAGLRALREEIESARRAAMMGQQLGRLASGRVKPTQETVDVTALLREALVQRGREIEARGAEVRQLLKPAWVLSDSTLVFTLLQSALDWCFEHACSRIDLQIEHRSWPAQAQLVISFAHRPADEVTTEPMPLDLPTLDTMSWRLLRQTAITLGLPVTRLDDRGRTRATLAFPRTLSDPNEALVSAGQEEPSAIDASNSKPLIGSHVLVIAARRELRNLVREALRPMGLMLDFAASIDEAREFCAGGLPHAIVHEETLGAEAFDRLRRELWAEVPTLAFIQISEEGTGFEVLSAGGREFSSVARSAIIESLPTALTFELARNL